MAFHDILLYAAAFYFWPRSDFFSYSLLLFYLAHYFGHYLTFAALRTVFMPFYFASKRSSPNRQAYGRDSQMIAVALFYYF